jgi:hypothetical protein
MAMIGQRRRRRLRRLVVRHGEPVVELLIGLATLAALLYRIGIGAH